MASFPLRVYDPATEQWYDICTGVAGPPGPTGPAGPVGATGPTGPAGSGTALPEGTEAGDLLWWDGTAWQILAPDGVPGHVLTETLSGGGAILPAWGGALASDAAIMCGMARFLAGQIERAFTWVRGQTITALQVWAYDETLTIGALLSFYTLLDPLFSTFSGALTLLNSALVAHDPATAAAAFPPLTPGQYEGVVCACYCGLHDTTGTGALTTSTLDAIRGYVDGYPNWIAASDGHYYQREAIDVILQTDLDWVTWAEIGSHQPQETCGHCLCG